MTTLSVTSLVAGYSSFDHILKGLNFSVKAGEIACIIGPNGAGKSTLLKAISGLLRPTEGRIQFGEYDITGRAPKDIATLGIAYVPQEHNVFPSLTLQENLEIGGYVEAGSIASRMASVMDRFPVLAAKRKKPARTLSGGERQILAMGMAMMVNPSLILLDEPSAGLSPVRAQELFLEIKKLSAEGIAIALVEQNATAALAVSDTAFILVDGTNRMTGKAQDISRDPDISRTFLGA